MSDTNFFDDTSDNQFHLLSGVLTESDLATLVDICRDNLAKPDAVPCYALIDKLSHPILKKIQYAVGQCVGSRLNYLNDFYIYTKGNVQANWHMDTELFTFENSCNAWILLSPDEVASPLAIMRGLNEPNGPYYHSAEAEGETYTFTNYKSGDKTAVSDEAMEAGKIEAPDVRRGDILVFNPKRFHKTNIQSPKHVLALKYVVSGPSGFKSQEQIPGLLWPETRLLNKLLKQEGPWSDVLAGIRDALATEKGRASLAAGNFPERTKLYRDALNELASKSEAVVS
ncbi:MAG: phytanoyl-CoA dioxygenase family protein [Hyphomicrobiaceae bacterium]